MSLAEENAEWICRHQIAPNIYGLKAVALGEVLRRLNKAESDHEALLTRLRALRETMLADAAWSERNLEDPKAMKVDGYYSGVEATRVYADALAALLVDPVPQEKD